MKNDLAAAEEAVQWFKNLFGDDYYLELQRHKTDKPNAAVDTYDKQKYVNEELVKLARKYNIKLIATNDVHYVEEEHCEAHDRLICLSTQKDFDDPNRMHYTKQEWLKTPEEMAAIFSDIPEALSNTQEIVEKVEHYSIDSDPIMPKFDIPYDFGTEEEYIAKIKGAGEIAAGAFEDAGEKAKKVGLITVENGERAADKFSEAFGFMTSDIAEGFTEKMEEVWNTSGEEGVKAVQEAYNTLLEGKDDQTKQEIAARINQLDWTNAEQLLALEIELEERYGYTRTEA
jgi:hypothetical protein